MAIRTKTYAKEAVSDPYTMYFHQTIKEDDSAQFLELAHKDFADFMNKGIFNWYLPEEFHRERRFPLQCVPWRKNDRYEQVRCTRPD